VVVIGVRSSLFLPFANLGLVIVDDEHDSSYRQQDTAPRFHARNAAIMLAHIHGAQTLLGSATPSLESYYNAKSGKYGFVALNVRYGNTPAPHIRIVDVKELRRKKMMKESLFSPLLKEKMEDALQQDKQIVIFQNRRGFALVMECKSCGDVVRCVNCDVSLTCHKHTNRLVCHYCGYSVAIPSHCPSCGAKEIKSSGFGTEKVEEEIETLFPDVRTNRLDYDTARTRNAYERILTNFEQGKSKILIGTQMLAKGLDLKQVSVVGVLNADSLMNIPDFRAHERAFQLMMQISSLAGRSHSQGSVVIQTSQPDHPLIQAVQAFDYERMAIDQLNERKAFRYPPYFRLIVLVLRCSNEQMLEPIAARYAEMLCDELGERVLPPFAPPVNRVQTLYVRHIMLKLETSLPVAHVRAILDRVNRQMQSFPGFSRIVLHYEVDN
jgi:primosomal protein N' (replication factor Y)